MKTQTIAPVSLMVAFSTMLSGCGIGTSYQASSTPIAVWTPVQTPVASLPASLASARTLSSSAAKGTFKLSSQPAARLQADRAALSNSAIAKLDGPAIVQVVANFGGNQLKPESGGSGSGFAVDHRQGIIITAAHVIEGAASVKVVLPNHERVPAVIIGRSDCDDLAVLKISTTHGLAQVKFGDSSAAVLGQDILAFGFPLPSLGTGLSVTPGTISQMDTSLMNYQDLLGVDAAINLGSSGGPVVDRQGRVLGITVLGVAGAENAHFAIASKYAAPILNQLAHGNNVHYIGLNLIPNAKRYQSFYGTSRGMIAVAVTSGSPADQIGVQPGDLLMRIEGSEVDNAGHLCDILGSRADGAVIKIQVYRPSNHVVLEGELVIGKLGVANPGSQNLHVVAVTKPKPTPTP